MSSDAPDSMSSGVSVVLCTVPEGVARALVDRLLDERLIACANLIGPVRSRYRWQGGVEEASEMLLVMKAPAAGCAGLAARIAELHEYEVPEVLELPVTSGLPAYLEWVAAACKAK